MINKLINLIKRLFKKNIKIENVKFTTKGKLKKVKQIIERKKTKR